MHPSKTLLYGTILVAQMFTALAAPSMANPPHNAEGKSSPKSSDPFANEAKGSETQVLGEIDEQLEKRQVWTRQPVENMAKYGRTSLQRSELPFIAKGTATGLKERWTISRNLPGKRGFPRGMAWRTALNYSTGASRAKSSSTFPPRIPVMETGAAISLTVISRAPLPLATIGETLAAWDFGSILAFEWRGWFLSQDR